MYMYMYTCGTSVTMATYMWHVFIGFEGEGVCGREKLHRDMYMYIEW